MDNFLPNQRWTSEGEPELGVGIVTETGKGRVKIHFPVPNEIRLYAMSNAPLRRVVFKPGDTVVDVDQRPLLIERVEQQGDLYIYLGEGRSLSETQLGEVSVQHGVEDRLFMGEVDAPRAFALRRATLEHDYSRRISPVSGFVGGRIDLIPHQLYIAHEVSSRYAPRVLLSDQVGLGKTIEACLILHRLLLSGRISRVLILVPDSLIHQWFVEILRRFNGWFHIFDEERCAAVEEGAPEGNPFLEDQLVICSVDFLAGSAKRASQAMSAGWDMLIVDEAHHLEWSVDKVSTEYAVVELLSKVAKGLLLLTATPEQLGVESHFARLRLLDPERYADYEAFKNEPQDHQEIANVVETLSSGKSLKPADLELLESLFGEERVAALTKGGASVRNNLIEDLLDQYGPGRVVFRNTRSAMSGFPKRKAHLVPIEVTKDHDLWLKRLSKEFSEDLKATPATRQRFWFAEDPRVDWLVELMDKLQPSKVLLICRTREKVLSLEKALAKRTGIKVAVFHEELTIVQRDRNAAWFSEPDGARLLLCSEIGSEGRNFQFAHHLVLFDLPAHPELLEQRIGRLDRIGQAEDIHIHIPYVLGTPHEVLVRWFHEGLNAFEENLEGGNQLAQLFRERLLNTTAVFGSSEADGQLDSLIADSSAFQKELKETLAKGRDRLLEMNSFRPKVAEILVEQIRAEDKDPGLENYMIRVFDQFGIDVEDLASRTYLLHPSGANTAAFPGIPDQGISITFDRKRALSREDVSFVSWDHPMATGAIDMVLGDGLGGAGFAILRGGEDNAVLIEALFVLETSGGQDLHVDRFLPTTPLRVVVDHTGEEVTEDYPVEMLNQRLIPGLIDDLLQNDTLVDIVLPKMLSTAREVADSLAAKEISEAMERMDVTMKHEIGRLAFLYKKNKDIRPDEIKIALKEQATLGHLINDARIRLDSIQLIRVDE
ncbi:MAG: RNA polymerase-associated protein RapA [Roseivirga sp.]|nr:RNA polymerase-associated protein RapA [Roseivirga sp.]